MGSLGTGAASSRLFQPLKVGTATLQHRMVMAPLTRNRADDAHVPTSSAVTYYTQRASVPGTLLITEGTFISDKAGNYANAPGIYSSEQIRAWRKVADAVHAKGSYIYCQLWALGRAANAADEGADLVSSSATPMDQDAATPRELSKTEIKAWVQDYAQAARNAIEAGFDGVEIHGANGYLPDQFLQDTCNVRTDEYGGSIENRSRFHLEVAEAVVAAVGAERTAIRLSPFSTFQGMKMADPIPQFTHLIQNLKNLKLAYLHVVEARVFGFMDIEATESVDFAIKAWDKTSPVLIAGGFKPASAKAAVDDEYKDYEVAIVFGRYFLSTPDLAFRIANGLEPNAYDRASFYTPKADAGYIDYPFSKEFELASKA